MRPTLIRTWSSAHVGSVGSPAGSPDREMTTHSCRHNCPQEAPEWVARETVSGCQSWSSSSAFRPVRVDPTTKSGLLRRPVEMRTHGAGTDEQALTDLSVGETCSDQTNDLPLPTGASARLIRHRVARLRDIGVISRNEGERDLANLNAIPVAQRMLPDTPTVDDGSVAAPEVDQQPAFVPELHFRMGTRHLGIIQDDDVVRRVPPNGRGVARKLVPRAVRPLETRHAKSLRRSVI